jgi:D-xylose transport system permease protein
MSSTATPPSQQTAAEVVKPANALKRLAEGELGSVRVIFMIALIWAIFQIAEDRFLTAPNLTNLGLQVVGTGLISIGVVLVLLLGEIDLSVGAVSGFAASVLGVLSVKHGWGPIPALLAAILVGAVIGLIQGGIATLLVIPPFIVTLAGQLGWLGAQLKVLGDTGTVNINDPTLVDLAGTFFSDGVGWTIAIVCCVLLIGSALLRQRRRVSAGLDAEPMISIVLRTGAASIAILGATAIFNNDRGMPLAVVILVVFVALFQWLTTRTKFGRSIYAVGGNAEAARRAGINVTRVRITVFVLASTMAAIGGIMLASRLLAVNQSSGGGDLLLLSIAGPVVAGVSLFGGRGNVWAALLGALVIGSISNGMDLLGLTSSVKYMITGAVLLVAVVIDALSRRRRVSVGRA